MMDALVPVALFAVGIIAGFAGNFISGGTSLIAVTSMLSLGLPPQLAVATQAAGSLGWRLGGLAQFWRANKIVWKLVAPLATLAFMGALIGTHILLAVDPALLKRAAGAIVLLFIPATLLRPKLGLQRRDITGPRRALGWCLYFAVAVWAGFCAAGAGIFFLYVYMFCFGLTILEIKGTDKIPGIFLDIGMMIPLAIAHVFNPLYVVAFAPGMFCGSALGARYALRLGNVWLREIVLASVALMGARLLLA